MTIPCDPELRVRLVRVAQQGAAPDLLLRGGEVWSPFTGEVLRADVAVCGDRVALVAPWQGPVEQTTEVVDAAGRVLVPGYLEPHTHPWPFLNPLSLGEGVVCRGTTSLVVDNLLLVLALGTDRFAELAADLSRRSLPHLFWVARIASQSRFSGEEEVFSEDAVAGLLGRPEFLATGETTRWVDLLDADHGPRLLRLVERARSLGCYVDGHTSGASPRRLPALAAAGLRTCHEAITAEEALARLRQGLWVLLRSSSLREDLVHLLPVLERTAFADRFAYTTDGAKAHHLEQVGHIDHLIRMALEGGVDPGVAYRMATLNPATCLGLEGDLGAIAPGRVAHVNVLTSLADPTPRAVVCRGRVVAVDGRLTAAAPSETFPWASAYAGGEPHLLEWGPEVFPLPPTAPDPFPTAQLVNAAINREILVPLRPEGEGYWPAAEDALVVALGGRDGGWVARGVVGNLAPGLAALAATYSSNGGFLVAGRSPRAMARVLGELRACGGGMVVLPVGGDLRRFPLPLAGLQLPGGFADACVAAKGFQQTLADCGYSHADPNYTLLFLSCDSLPDLRLTRAGWVRIKTGEVLLPSSVLG
ncbi:MAG: adenine deaminase C-terminal domain-containing protein [Deferrisomatales bacterium]|nr:adenine deaminase C-terminal domain-containing protein [Deferrisomatales bacterium]